MLFKEDDVGLVAYMRNCLKGATYGDPARITIAADFRIYLDKKSKMTVPTIVVTPGRTTVVDQTVAGSNIVRHHLVEQIDIMVILDAKRDKSGNFPVDDVHFARLDLIGCLLGFNPSILAQCATPPVEYGYCTQEIRYVSDDWFAFDDERYVHEFEFALWSEINNIEQGVGVSQPPTNQDLNKILLDIEPSLVSAGEQPAVQAEIDGT